ncbi:MAG: SDR family NAD(P)-dependent oxidoreductase, partial [Bacteroidales bacterium]
MKKAIIVGASSGIGKELAKILAENHYQVGITGRRTELLNELKQTNPVAYCISTFDITNTETSTLHLENLVAELGGLDLLFISSGTG